MSKRAIIYVFGFLAFAAGLTALAQSDEGDFVDLVEGMTVKSLYDHIYIIHDEHGNLSYEDISSGAYLQAFDKATDKKGGFDSGKQIFWIYFDVANANIVEGDFLISLPEFDRVELFCEQSNYVPGDGVDGMLTRLNNKGSFYGNDIYLPVSLPIGPKVRFYARLENATNFSEQNVNRYEVFEKEATIALQSHVESTYLTNRYVHGIFFGIMLIIALYNAAVFWFDRDFSDVFYSLFLLFSMLDYATEQGFTFEFLWPEMPRLNLLGSPFFVSMSWMFFTLFTRAFLDLSEKSIWRRLLTALTWGQGLIMLSFALGYWNVFLQEALTLVSMLVIFLANLASLQRGFAPARYFLVGNVFYFVGETFKQTYDWFPSYDYFADEQFLLDFGGELGASFQVLFFSVGLADRVNVLRSQVQRQQEEREALRRKQEEERQRLIEQQRNELEDQVKARTTELRKALDEISLLKEIGQEITATLELSEMVEIVKDNISEVISAAGFAIGVINEEEQQIELVGYTRKGREVPERFIPLSNSKRLAVWAVQNRKEVFINDLEKEYEKYTNTKFFTEDIEEKPKSLIYIPLTFEDNVLGVLMVQNFQADAFDALDLDFLKNLAIYISIALNNARIYHQIAETKDALQYKNKQITDSLRYGMEIQSTILPQREQLERYFSDLFIIYRPRDMVSGDFYWAHFEPDKHTVIFAVIDCTGHGVPGAFMSMTGNTLFNEIVRRKQVTDPAEILGSVHRGVRKILRQEDGRNDDGMDVALCTIRYEPGSDEVQVTYAGAKQTIFYYCCDDKEVKSIRGDRHSIGGVQREDVREYTNKEITIRRGDYLYLSTDGFMDQNNARRKKFGRVRFQKALHEVGFKPMAEQRQILEQMLDLHKGQEEQRDDITVVGIQL